MFYTRSPLRVLNVSSTGHLVALVWALLNRSDDSHRNRIDSGNACYGTMFKRYQPRFSERRSVLESGSQTVLVRPNVTFAAARLPAMGYFKPASVERSERCGTLC